MQSAWFARCDVQQMIGDGSEHIVRKAQQGGEDPQEFANHMFEHNHIPGLVQEILRGKALARIVESAVVTDASGNPVDLKNLRPDGTIGAPEDEAAEGEGESAEGEGEGEGESAEGTEPAEEEQAKA